MGSTRVKLVYEGVQIAQGEDAEKPGSYMVDTAGDLVSVEYTDNSDGMADDLQIALYDRDGLWRSKWLPKKGSKLQATIYPAFGEGALECGEMWIDEVEVGGPPSIAVIRAVSLPIGEELRATKKTRAWENVTLEQMATKIAKDAGLGIYYKGETVELEHIDQHEETDLSMLRRLGADYGYVVKVASGKVVIYDQQELEDAKAVAVIDVSKGDGLVTRWGIRSKTRGVYRAARVMYRDPIRKLVAEALSEHKDRVLKEPEFIAPKPRGKHRRLTEAQKKERERARQERAAKRFEKKHDRYLDSLIRQSREEERKALEVVEVDDVEFLLSPSGTPLVGDVLNISRRAKDLDDAKRIAVRSLRNANRNEVTLHLEAAGDIALRAGLNIEVVGAGDFSGKYHIDGAHQSVRGAFHTSVDGHKVLAY